MRLFCKPHVTISVIAAFLSFPREVWEFNWLGLILWGDSLVKCSPQSLHLTLAFSYVWWALPEQTWVFYQGLKLLSHGNVVDISALVIQPQGDWSQVPSANISPAAPGTRGYACCGPGKHSKLTSVSTVQVAGLDADPYHSQVFQ